MELIRATTHQINLTCSFLYNPHNQTSPLSLPPPLLYFCPTTIDFTIDYFSLSLFLFFSIISLLNGISEHSIIPHYVLTFSFLISKTTYPGLYLNMYMPKGIHSLFAILF